MKRYLDEFCESPRVSLLVIVLFILFLFTTTLEAGMVAKDSVGNAVWLYGDACVEAKALGKIHPDHRSKFKRAEMLYMGKKYAACWAVGPDNKVYILDEIGDLSVLPMQAFVPMLGS